ncbi:MAG: 3-isopropylmalate dehydratase large subunit [Desulfovibrio sp.]
MKFTLAQKVFANHGKNLDSEHDLEAGRIVTAAVSLVLANDITGAPCAKSMKGMGAEKVFDKDKVVFVMDHFVPQKDVASAEQVKLSREFATEQNLTHYYEGGDAGVEHALLPELGLVGPGDLVVGADSHTCTYGGVGALGTGMGSADVAACMALGETWFKVPETIRVEYEGVLPQYMGGKDLILWLIGQIGVDGARYKALEFGGPAIDALSVEGRLTMANMAIEAGGKCGLFAADGKTLEFCREAGRTGDELFASDAGAVYERVISCDVSTLSPVVACPHLPENTAFAKDLAPTPIHQVVIGSCTNGRIEDMRAAAAILRGRKVKKGVRCIVLPATPKVVRAMLREGIMETMLEAGCVVGPPSCGPCLGGHLGILAGGERAISTTNRNFKGRMGSLESELYLANPYVAAASAVTGIITDPGAL